MAEFEQQEIPFKERRLRSTKLRRGIFLLPSMFTVANLLCGYYGVVASFVHGLKPPLHDERWAMVWLFVVAALGALMTSTVRYYSFKDVPWTRRQPSLAIVLLCLFVAVVWKYSEVVLTLFASCYVVGGLVVQLIRVLRHRVASRTA